MIRKAIRLLALGCIGLLGLEGAAQAQDRLKVATGGRGGWEVSVTELGMGAGMFKKHGLDIDLSYTEGSGETMQAAISGAVDLALGIGPFGLMGAYARGAPVRIIGGSMTGVNDQFWYAQTASPIKTGKDLAGRTVAYSTSGASTNAVVLGFKRTFGVDFTAVPTGGQAATLTQVLSGQIDVGWAAAPFAFKHLEAGTIKIVARANEVPELRQQSVRVMTANAAILGTKRDQIIRFLRGYRDTVDWMYTSDEAVERYAKIVDSTVEQARRTRDEFIKKEDLNPDRVEGLELLMKDAIAFKFLSAPLSAEQLRELVVRFDK